MCQGKCICAHKHIEKEVREESLYFCDVYTVYENIDGPQGGRCTGYGGYEHWIFFFFFLDL